MMNTTNNANGKTMTTAIRIHSFPLSGHSHRVQLFASLAGIPHELVYVDLPKNPFGEVPVIEDEGVVISDSNAILVYLARKYAPSFLPTDPVLEAEVQKFLTLAAGEVAFGPAAARIGMVFNSPYDIDFTRAVADKVFGKLEEHLAGRDYLVGDAIKNGLVGINLKRYMSSYYE